MTDQTQAHNPFAPTTSARLTVDVRPVHEVSFGPDYVVASDMAALIYNGAVLLGWGDDYGTVTHPDHDLSPALKEAAETFIEAASELWAQILVAADEPAASPPPTV